MLLQERKDRRGRPRLDLNRGAAILGQHALDVLGQSAARDMGHRAHHALSLVAVQHRLHRIDIDPRRPQHRIAQRLAKPVILARKLQPLRLNHPAHQRIPVGMNPRRRKPDDHIASFHPIRLNRARQFHHAHRKTRQLNHPRLIDSRQLCRLPAQERTTRLTTSFGDPFHDRNHLVRFDRMDSQVIQKEQRFRPAGDQIVDVHRHQIDPNRRKVAHLCG